MKQVLIGIENFKELIDKDYYYVDRTLFVSDVLEERVALCIRPRRFGKTLNMNRRCPPRCVILFLFYSPSG